MITNILISVGPKSNQTWKRILKYLKSELGVFNERDTHFHKVLECFLMLLHGCTLGFLKIPGRANWSTKVYIGILERQMGLSLLSFFLLFIIVFVLF